MTTEIFDAREWQKRNLRGFGFMTGDAANLQASDIPLSGKWSVLSCPDWFPLALLGLLATRIARRQWLWFQRGRRGLCRNCGYDLRASPDRCPECGTASAAPTPTRTKAPSS